MGNILCFHLLHSEDFISFLTWQHNQYAQSDKNSLWSNVKALDKTTMLRCVHPQDVRWTHTRWNINRYSLTKVIKLDPHHRPLNNMCTLFDPNPNQTLIIFIFNTYCLCFGVCVNYEYVTVVGNIIRKKLFAIFRPANWEVSSFLIHNHTS